MVGLSSLLVELKLLNVKGLTQIHGEDLMHLGAVELLYINNCDELRYLWERESEACKSLVSLRKLVVLNCNKLVASAEKEDNFEISLESIKEVTFRNCNTLECYNCPNSVEKLEITSCDSLTSLSLSTVQGHPSSPTELITSDCDKIQPIQAKRFEPIKFENIGVRVEKVMLVSTGKHNKIVYNLDFNPETLIVYLAQNTLLLRY
ncbi:hypothetical protein L2E82_30153 [Cichorium intybus]|uniref:Uncharacterized protein n=1 Tax=Cichorium intybus TaxID=13427 RepID=A0ACB9CZL7_CICIN|nr:hypothetical protein L2E82_30153 [Cichorium intybus]